MAEMDSRTWTITIVIVILVIAVIVAAIFYSGVLNPAPSSNNPEVEITSPTTEQRSQDRA